MKTKAGAWLSSLAVCLVAVSAQADPLLVENWDGATINSPLTISGDPLNNLGEWYGFGDPRWDISDDSSCTAPCDGPYAHHLVQSGDNTNTLYYGIAGSFVTGTTILVSFDYALTESSLTRAQFGLLGLTAGVSILDPYAPFWYDYNPDTDDGTHLINAALGTSNWTNASFSVTLTEDYDALAFIVAMGGTGGLRGIDNINVSTMAVPEPASLALFGLGLAGFGFARRRKA